MNASNTKTNARQGTRRGEKAIQHWLVTHIASLMNQSPEEIDITQPFSSFALDSVATVGMTGDLEDWLGIALPPTLIWDYPSIELLARHLAALENV